MSLVIQHQCSLTDWYPNECNGTQRCADCQKGIVPKVSSKAGQHFLPEKLHVRIRYIANQICAFDILFYRNGYFARLFSAGIKIKLNSENDFSLYPIFQNVFPSFLTPLIGIVAEYYSPLQDLNKALINAVILSAHQAKSDIHNPLAWPGLYWDPCSLQPLKIEDYNGVQFTHLSFFWTLHCFLNDEEETPIPTMNFYPLRLSNVFHSCICQEDEDENSYDSQAGSKNVLHWLLPKGPLDDFFHHDQMNLRDLCQIR